MSTAKPNCTYPAAPTDGADELREALPLKRRLPDEEPHPMQIEIYRRMTPGRRLELAEEMYWSARRMKWAWIRSQHSDWTDAQVEGEVTHIFSHARG